MIARPSPSNPTTPVTDGPAKNAAVSQNCFRDQRANGWSWHWAHSIFTPRNSRDVEL